MGYCEANLHSVSIAPARDWRSVFWDDKYKSLFVVYVNDFKMAGPSESLPTARQLIRSGIKTEEPEELSKHLGC